MSRFVSVASLAVFAACVFVVLSGGAALAGPPTICGDGVMEGPELCDDGNTVAGDGCSDSCFPEVCGDGLVEPGTEECDDGNTVDFDGCSSICACEVGQCGNGILTTQCGEVCDDGNTVGGDGCDAGCQLEAICGDGLVEGAEVCDDGNTVSGDGCSADCLELEQVAQSRDQQRCINELNKRGAGVLKAAGREARRCVQNIARGRELATLDACLRSDARGRIDRAAGRTVRGEERRCSDPLPTFGSTEAAVVNQAAQDQSIADFEDVLGAAGASNLVPTANDRDAARCQSEVARATQATQDRANREVNRAKRNSLAGRRGTPQAENSAELGDALLAALTGERVARQADRNDTRIARRCEGADLAALFPGAAVDTADLATFSGSVTARARCRVCLYLNTADDLALDCDLADNRLADASCS